MKKIKQFTCFLVCFILLSNSFIFNSYALLDKDPFEGYIFNSADSMPSYEDLVDVLDPYAPMLLVEPLYDYYPTNDFSLTTAVTTSSNFIYWEDLPYGLDTIVTSYSVSNTIYFIFLDGTVLNAMQQTWSTTYGYIRVKFTSNSPVYRIAYNRTTGSYVSFYSKTGLATDYTDKLESASETVYAFAYTFSAGDYNVCVSSNTKNLYADMELNGEYDEAIFGSGQYPKKSDVSFELEKENNQTSKSIWETLKSVLQYIINLPANIANSIRDFFTNLGDRISGFFDTLKNYLLYFQAEEPEHENPFVDIISYIKSFFNSQITNAYSFSNSLDDTLENVSGYIETGSSIIDTLLNGVPILNTVLIFFLAFAVIRKVVGR